MIFIFLVVIVVLVCLGVCFLVGKQKKVSTEEQEAFDELGEFLSEVFFQIFVHLTIEFLCNGFFLILLMSIKRILSLNSC